MSGSNQYHEKCVCGAEITVSENFSFSSTAALLKRFDDWRRAHKSCLPLFIRIQEIRANKLTGVGIDNEINSSLVDT